MGKHLTPYQVCAALIGPPPVLSAICGLNDKAAYLWRRPSKGRAAGDIASTAHMRRLLAHAEALGLGLTARHLICGADEDEIERILAARGNEPGGQPMAAE